MTPWRSGGRSVHDNNDNDKSGDEANWALGVAWRSGVPRGSVEDKNGNEGPWAFDETTAI